MLCLEYTVITRYRHTLRVSDSNLDMKLEDYGQRYQQQKLKSIFLFFKQKHAVEIKILYKILILYVHKIILLITKLKSFIRRLWLVTPDRDP